jgi:N-acetylglucosaminyldiphosphoundecaprenol N-acetyl-beta-D-mannosaminyltransferase
VECEITDRARVLGCEIDRVDFERALRICEQAIESRRFVQHMAINAAKLVTMRTDELLRQSVGQCELITADGQSIVWASRLLRDPLPERVAGIDLMVGLLERAATNGYRVYILGAKPEVLEAAVIEIRSRYPRIVIAGARDGYYSDVEQDEVAASIAASDPDILFVAMTSPRKEYFLERYGRVVRAPFVMGVGGAIDVLAGVTVRAPVPLQHLGLEWLFRLVQEPRRLAKRYWHTNLIFVGLLSRAMLRRYVLRSRPTGGGFRPTAPNS